MELVYISTDKWMDKSRNVYNEILHGHKNDFFSFDSFMYIQYTVIIFIPLPFGIPPSFPLNTIFSHQSSIDYTTKEKCASSSSCEQQLLRERQSLRWLPYSQ